MKNFIYCFLIVTFFSSSVILKENAVNYRRKLIDKFELVVFLKKDVSAPEVIKEKLLRIENLKAVEFISKESVKNKLQKVAEEITLAGENPFPDSFSIQPKQISNK
ncbi:MAG: permease-like cell division protein FtsX, partial [Elusimicrobiota bacterium]|nr:permease-like cell division protein FtsX [Elusimicrobiota bacterium]